jgi:hypothetical protein
MSESPVFENGHTHQDISKNGHEYEERQNGANDDALGERVGLGGLLVL